MRGQIPFYPLKDKEKPCAACCWTARVALQQCPTLSSTGTYIGELERRQQEKSEICENGHLVLENPQEWGQAS
ncbi:unnamed protein product, partial [marine sediment metagenome]